MQQSTYQQNIFVDRQSFLPRRLCSLRGIVIMLSVCMCMYVCMDVNSRRFFLGAPAAFYIGTGHPMGNISRRFFRIFEIFIFG